MISIKFNPDSEKQEIVKSVKEYQEIWDKEGDKIVQAIEKVSGFSFAEAEIEAVVYEGAGHSNPFQLNATYSKEVKKGKLMHELCHRLVSDNNIIVKINNSKDKTLEIHKLLYLILYDVWSEAGDEEFARAMVEIESRRSSVYENAWVWALNLSKEERAKKFRDAAPKKL
ncbi:MAG: hypothetical protein V1698_02915 [bacterium]